MQIQRIGIVQNLQIQMKNIFKYEKTEIIVKP